MRKKDLCITFDLWETLILDQPELDLERGRLRCEGIHKALKSSGIDLPLRDMENGYDKSAHLFQSIWKRNNDLSTLEQIRTILDFASENNVPLPQDPETLEKLLRSYVDPLLKVPPPLNEDAVSTLEGLRD